ncbi:ATP-binding protein [Cyclobacterium marinum]|uniref:ATP-binding protein n=1 Tax=Cyclobacterium marinum TaxID=104 RepID=UPI0011F02B8F|nr:tetratricopeptide repeat-containing sensor histidine kinase [Cyclobacterium marinum]MBI0398865.1 tetratricopeptide repeat protein [Cyclobacterium marinum]
MAAFFNLKIIFSIAAFLSVMFATHSLYAQTDTIQSQVDELQALENRENFSPTINFIDQLNRLGEIYYHRNPDSLYLLAMKSLKASEQISYTAGKVDAYRNIGAYHNLKGEYTQALSYFKEGLSLAEKEEYWLGLANIYNSMGLNDYERGNYSDAVTHYLQALKIKEKHLSKLEQSKTLNNLGLVFMDFGDIEKALAYHTRALKIREAYNDQTGIASSRINIALIYKERGELEEAMSQFEATLELGLKMNNRQLISVSYFNIGELFLLRGANENAYRNFEKAYFVDKEREDLVGIGFDLLGMGEAQLNMNQLHKAKQNIQESLEIFVESDIKSNIDKSHLLLSKVFEKMNDNAQALHHFKLHKLYQDSIVNLETNKQIQEISAKYEFDKKETELLQQQKEKDLLNEKRIAQNIRNGVSIILIILLIAFILAIRSIKVQTKAKALVTKQRNEYEKLNKRLLLQKKENEKITKQLFQVNETKDKIFSIVGHDLKSPVTSLKGLMQYVVDENLDRKEFLLVSKQLRNEVEQVHFTLVNLLNWAKGQMRGIVTDPTTISMHQLVEQNISLNEPISKNKNIEIVDELEENTICYADKDQISLALRNVLNNAIKFTPKGGKIIISSKKAARQGFWEISIQDNGIGMSDEILKNLFSKELGGKQQYGTEGEKGTGLGLQLTKDFIIKNGGEIKVSSKPNNGTTFTFTIPSAYV